MSILKEIAPWFIAGAIAILAAILILWFSAEPENTLPDVYGVM